MLWWGLWLMLLWCDFWGVTGNEFHFLWGIRLFINFFLPRFPHCLCVFWDLLGSLSPQAVLPLCYSFSIFLLLLYWWRGTGWVAMDSVVVSPVVVSSRVFAIILAVVVSAAETSGGTDACNDSLVVVFVVFQGDSSFWWPGSIVHPYCLDGLHLPGHV